MDANQKSELERALVANAFGMKNLDKLWILSEAGSRAYGVETPSSDYDYRGVYRAPEIEDFFRQEIQHPINISVDGIELDAKLTAQVSFLRQLITGSFTAIEVLWDPNPLFVDADFAKVFHMNPRFLTASLASSYWGCFGSYAKLIDFARSHTEITDKEKLKKALYHSFRNLEKIEMIAEQDNYQLRCLEPDFLKSIRSGELPILDAISELDIEKEKVEKLYSQEKEGLPKPPTFEELFEITNFMRLRNS